MEFSATQPTDALVQEAQTKQYDEIIAALKAGNRILAVSHERPDGDAVGSVSGLVRSLRKAGKRVDACFSTPIPPGFFFAVEEEIIPSEHLTRIDYDLVVVLDTGDQPRTGFNDFLEATKALVINIDHHPSNTLYGDLNLTDFEACSTCEIIVDLLRRASLPFDAEVAEGLYLGMLTDTRFFQNEKIRPSAFSTAAALLATGLDTGPILGKLNRQRTLSELRLLGLGLQKLETSLDGRMVKIVLSRADFAAAGAVLENAWSCGLFGQMIALKEAVVGVCLMESAEGKCFAEFRSVGGFNVKDIAVSMGGGGHLAASGCNRSALFSEFVQEAAEKVEARLRTFLSSEK